MSKNAKYNHKNRLVAAQALLKRNRGILLIMIGVFVLIFYGVSILKKHTATSGTAPLPSASITITASNSTPSERKIPTDTSAYVVPATQPRKILVPEIGVEGLIQKVGRTNKNAIAVPSSIYIAGWYVDSVLPGQKGLSIIDGHINGTYNPGIFYNLQNLTIGDKFMIEFGDYSKKTFEVVDKKQLPESQTAGYMYTHKNDIESQLNVVTCGGKYNKSIKSYDDRIVVVSKLVPN